MSPENSELSIYSPKSTRLDWLLDRLPILGARRVERKSTVELLVRKIKNDINQYGFTYEEQFPRYSEKIGPRTNRWMPLFLKSNDVRVDVGLSVITDAVEMFDLDISNGSHSVHLTQVIKPEESGYLQWIQLEHKDLPFMKELLTAKVDELRLQYEFDFYKKKIDGTTSKLLYWNKDHSGGALTSIN